MYTTDCTATRDINDHPCVIVLSSVYIQVLILALFAEITVYTLSFDRIIKVSAKLIFNRARKIDVDELLNV